MAAIPAAVATRRPPRPAAVLWDMDGTLVDSEKVWDVSLTELARELGGDLPGPVRDAMVGSNMTRTMELLFAELGLGADPDAVGEAEQWLTERTRRLFEAGLPWRPGAREALHSVRRAGIATALVTSTLRELTEVALRTIGPHLFDVTVCGDEVTRNKPHPESYLTAARRLGADPASCIAVEDSPTGVASAVAAGCTVLVVPCEIPVETGERRVLRNSLVGVDADLLGALLHPNPVNPNPAASGAGCEDGRS